MGYDFADLPLRYIASAGGLLSCDAYVIIHRVENLESGSYYFDATAGFKLLARGTMLPHIAYSIPNQEWLAEASLLVVAVTNLDRVTHKYGATAAKLAMLDVGIALANLELVSAALELRSTVLGALPVDDLRRALCLSEPRRIPVASVAIGTRGHYHG